MRQDGRTPGVKQGTDIPVFFLYGEAPQKVDRHFLHLEDLDDRSRPNDWNIRPHAHETLHHMFFVRAGSGQMSVDGERVQFVAPTVLLIPARCVHGFAWDPETSGHVLTLSESYLAELATREAIFHSLFETADSVELPPGSREDISIMDNIRRLSLELSWIGAGSAAAVEAHLTMLLVDVLRLSRHNSGRDQRGPQVQIVARFRQAIEDNFHKTVSITDYAELLGLNVWQLRTACLKIAHLPPLHIVQQRKLLEAQRLLLYSNMSVSEVAYHLGFDDPAYFSRVFHRHAGVSPRLYRTSHAGKPA